MASENRPERKVLVNPEVAPPSSPGPPPPRVSSLASSSRLAESLPGVELARAIEELRQVLQGVSRNARQHGGRFDIEPVELTLQVGLARIDPGAAALEWRVLCVDEHRLPQVGPVHTLKMRVAPLLGEVGQLSANTDQPVSDRPDQGFESKSDAPDKQYYQQDDNHLNSVLGPAATPANITFVRLRVFYGPHEVPLLYDKVPDGPSRITQLVVERTALTVSPSESSKILAVIRDKSREGIEEYVANMLVQPGWSQLSQLWLVKDPGGFAAGANAVGSLQDNLHKFLIGDPTEKIASGIGIPDPSFVGVLAADIPFLAADQYLNSATLGFELVGIVVGVATGIPPLACASLKLLVHNELKHAVVTMVKEATKPISHSPGPTVQEPISHSPEPTGQPPFGAPRGSHVDESGPDINPGGVSVFGL